MSEIDAYFDEWWDLKTLLEEERDRLLLNERRLKEFREVTTWVRDDLDILDKIASDCYQGIFLMADGRQVDKGEIDKVIDLYNLAIIVVTDENDMLEGFWSTGFAAALLLFPFAMVEARAQQLQKLLKALQEKLLEAKREEKNVRIQTLFDVAGFAFGLAMPELSLLARGSVWVTGVLVGKILEPKKPTPKPVDSAVIAGIEQYAEAVHEVEELSEKTRAMAKAIGKVATIATFYFDVDELKATHHHTQQIKTAIKHAKKAYDELVAITKKNQSALKSIVVRYQTWMRKIDEIDKQARANRQTLLDHIKQYNYPLNRPKVWVTSSR